MCYKQQLLEKGTKVIGIIGLFGFHVQLIATCQQRRDRKVVSLQENHRFLNVAHQLSSVCGPSPNNSRAEVKCSKWHARLEPSLPPMKVHGSDLGRCGINHVDVPGAEKPLHATSLDSSAFRLLWEAKGPL